MAKNKLPKPPMDPKDLEIQTSDVTEEQFPKGIPTNPDGSVKSGGEIPVEQAASIGALDAESAQHNKTQARLLHKKNKGEGGVSWSDKNALNVFDNVRQVSAWHTANIKIYIDLVKEIDESNPDPKETLFNFQPMPMAMFKDAGDFYSYVQNKIFRDSPYDSTYLIRFKEGGRQIRGTGYLAFKGVSREPAPQQPSWNGQPHLQHPYGGQSPQSPPYGGPQGYGGPPPFGAPPSPYGMQGMGYGAPQLPPYYAAGPPAYPQYPQQPMPEQPYPPQHTPQPVQAPVQPQPAPQPPPPQNYPPPYQPPPGPDPTMMNALGQNYHEAQRVSMQLEILTRQLAESQARAKAMEEWAMSGRMGAPPPPQVIAAPLPPPPPPEPPPVIAFPIPCTRCGQPAGPSEIDIFDKLARMQGRVHRVCPTQPAQPAHVQQAPAQPQQGMGHPMQQQQQNGYAPQSGYAPPQQYPQQYGPQQQQPQQQVAQVAAVPFDPMQAFTDSISGAAKVFDTAVTGVERMQSTMQRMIPKTPEGLSEAIDTQGQSVDDSPYGTFPILNGEGQIMYDRETKKPLHWGLQLVNNAPAVGQLVSALGGVVKDMLETVRLATGPKPGAPITTQGYPVQGHGLPPAQTQQVQQQQVQQQQVVQQPVIRQPPPPAVFQPPNFGGFTG